MRNYELLGEEVLCMLLPQGTMKLKPKLSGLFVRLYTEASRAVVAYGMHIRGQSFEVFAADEGN
jgi:hypothetical protein